ncbi:hypothetical protein FQN55_007468 [Onygenales sp. PD_40]|nr:hypothetical protein FQN55_007468 [Onygenales sp. PD_40]
MQVLRQPTNPHLHGVVDMGSNGIRFSISDLSPPTARIIPTLFQDRAGISLYDAQHEKGSSQKLPISDKVQKDVVSCLLRFKQTCVDFGVPATNIYVLATEATRTAPNSEEFREKIRKATDWEVQMLSKEEEGRIGSLGIASSLGVVEGLVMDLGGGSTQITWMSPTAEASRSLSFPYGAAALTKKLEEAKNIGKGALNALAEEMTTNFRQAYQDLEVPAKMIEHARHNGGFDLYLSGGGFRGWGYLLMNQSEINPYPIQIINGFKVPFPSFENTTPIEEFATASKIATIFRVSDRRRAQAPAVAFLINVLAHALPKIKDVHFCQGGVREGFLFDKLPPEIRQQDPLVTSTIPHRKHSPSSSALASLLLHAFPDPSSPSTPPDMAPPPLFTNQFISAVANIMYAHSPATKESRSSAALHSTTTGILCSTHGLSHTHRAALALVLYDSCAGDLPPQHESFLGRLRRILSIQEAWWCRYLGRVVALVSDIYPAGVVEMERPRVGFEARCVRGGLGKKGRLDGLVVAVRVPKGDGGVGFAESEFLKVGMKRIEKIGKRKHWVQGPGGPWGIKIEAGVEEGL